MFWMYSIRDNERVTKSFYIISSVLHAFWLVLTYVLLENRRIDDVIIKSFFFLMFWPHFDVLCDVLLNRHTATWNLFVKYNSIEKNLPADFTLLTVERVLVNTYKMLTLWAEIFWQFYATVSAGLTFFVYLN